MSMQVTERQVYSWLSKISADIERNEWVRALMAIKATNLPNAREIAEAWSRSASGKFSQKNFNRTWDRIDNDASGVGVGTLVMMSQGRRPLAGGSVGGSAPAPPARNHHPTSRLRRSADQGSSTSAVSEASSKIARAGDGEKKRPEGVWIARDWNGERVSTHLRFSKDERPWSPAINPLDLTFYNSHLAQQAYDEDKLNAIIIVEGEKCADALHKAFRPKGIIVLGTYGTSWYPKEEDAKRLVSFAIESAEQGEDNRIDIILWCDSQDVGRNHMRNIAKHLFSAGYRWDIRIIDLMPLSQEDEDCVDWLKMKTRADFSELVELAKIMFVPREEEPQEKPNQEPAAPQPAKTEDEAEEVEAEPLRIDKIPKPNIELEVVRTPKELYPDINTVSAGSCSGMYMLTGQTMMKVHQALSALNIHVRYNKRTQREEVRYPRHRNNRDFIGTVSDQYTDWVSLHEKLPFLHANIESKCAVLAKPTAKDPCAPIKLSRLDFKYYMEGIVSEYEIDPFKLWLENELPEWDRVFRLENYILDLFGSNNHSDSVALARWAALAIPTIAIQRSYDPDTPLPHVPILVGAQGVGKSALLRNILPPENRRRWFSDGFHIDDDHGRQIEACLGRVIVEIPEMAGLRNADWQKFKNFISSSNVESTRRLAYRRDATPLLRNYTICGTSDKIDGSLQYDPAGQRRFVIIELLHGGNVEKYMDENRDQIWAEALYRFTIGDINAFLPRHLSKAQARIVNQHVIQNDLQIDMVSELPDKLKMYFSKPYIEPGTYVKMIDIFRALGLNERNSMTNNAELRRIRAALLEAGWKLKQNTNSAEYVGGGSRSGNFWIHP